MKMLRRIVIGVIALAAMLGAAASANAQQARLIVKFKAGGAKSALTAADQIKRLGGTTGLPLRELRGMALGAQVVTVDGAYGDAAALRIAAQVARNPDVEFAQVDHLRHAMAAYPVNDEFIAAQTYLVDSPTALNAFDAWTVTHGSPSVTVAVVDTGYRPHAGMAGRFLAGYDMISDPAVANDGDGRDPDASDPGDWLTPAMQTGQFAKCAVGPSSWHGTGVASVIAANTNDGLWTAGIDWNAKILPVRALGRCGGYDSDIVDGIAWAAGLPVPGVPANPTPAEVINLSLGGTGNCDPVYPPVIAAAYAHGVTRAIVVAAGNGATDVANDTPANCPGVIAVASTTTTGGLASYSNFGAGITLSAPGGVFHYLRQRDAILVLSNSGTTVPVADSFAFEGGTSLAAPMVSGTVSLMLSVNPALTPDQVVSILTSTSSPFLATSGCTTALCGAGIVNAGAAVRAAAATGAAAPNYQGLWWAAPAGSESGWGINFAHQGDIIFATWFTYDTTGKAWWLALQANRSAPGVYAGTIFTTRGPPFNAVPFDPARVTEMPVGSATLSFRDANDASFAYTVNGVSQTKTLVREVFAAPVPVCSFGGTLPQAQASNYQDLWWASPAGVESGWGMNLTHQGDVIFATWFTYDANGDPLWLSGPAQKTSAGVYAGTLYRTTGPGFNAVPFEPSKVTQTPVGTLTLSFSDGANGTFAYTVNGVSQVKAITREVFVAPGTVCQ
ncbi:MAG: S8 family peptidase [Betaproteobacteria bacterium]|nr:S8 family peptidase [Betaproteobacteria bacterium]